MSFNPVLARVGRDESDLMPMPAVGEKMVLKRQGIHVDMKVASKSYAGKGYLFLTTTRCVFIKEGKITSHKNWSSLEFPLRTIYGEKGSGHPPEFHQPVFGANYMAGVTPPNDGAQYPFAAAGVWKWQFKEGGCAAFVKAFYALYKAATRGGPTAVDAAAHNIMGPGGAAYMDPTDPSIIFVQQPSPQEPYCFNPQSQAYGPMPMNQYPVQQGTYGPPPPQYGAPSPYGPPQYGMPPQGGGAQGNPLWGAPPQPPYPQPLGGYASQAYPPPGVPQQSYQQWNVGAGGGYAPPQYQPLHPTAAGYPPHPGPFGHPLYPSAYPVPVQGMQGHQERVNPTTAIPNTEAENRMLGTPSAASKDPPGPRVGTGFSPAPVDEAPVAARPARVWMEPRPQMEPERPEPQIPENVRQAVENIETRLQEQGTDARRAQ